METQSDPSHTEIGNVPLVRLPHVNQLHLVEVALELEPQAHGVAFT
jgi:hypothetical protein